MNDANDTQIGWWFIFGALFLLAWVIIFAAGAAKRIVLFYDYSDVKISAAAAVVGIVAAPLIFVCVTAKPFSSGIANFAFGFTISAVIGFVSLYMFWIAIRSAIFYNKSIPIGIAVGLFKISFVVIMISLIASKIEECMKKSRKKNLSRWDLLFALLFISFLAYLFKTAVNGESVYSAKGWSSDSVSRS